MCMCMCMCMYTGDAFYVMVLSGEAAVTRTDDADGADGAESELATLADGACFGERALLKHEPRYATIRAKSKLRTLCITRATFEAKFGPLAALMDADQYEQAAPAVAEAPADEPPAQAEAEAEAEANAEGEGGGE